jgi:hypothetical protein
MASYEGYICESPQFSANSSLTGEVVPCIHDPAFAQQQLIVALVVWATLLFFSIVWILLSRRQNNRLKHDEIGFSLSLRSWARKSRFAIIMVGVLSELLAMSHIER